MGAELGGKKAVVDPVDTLHLHAGTDKVPPLPLGQFGGQIHPLTAEIRIVDIGDIVSGGGQGPLGGIEAGQRRAKEINHDLAPVS